MKRSPLKRKTPLARGKPLARTSGLDRTPGIARTCTPMRRTRIRARNPKRKAATFARNYGERGALVRAMPCVVAGCRHQSEAAHVKARGMGGAKGDKRGLWPGCQMHHTEAGEFRTTARARFEARYKLDLIAIAERIALQLDAEGIP